MSELLKNSIITNVELHAGFLILIGFLFENMRKSFIRNGRGKNITLYSIYLCSALMIISDCIWSSISSIGYSGEYIGYLVNLVYFISSSTAAACWFVFSSRELEARFTKSRRVTALLLLPYLIVNILYLISPLNGVVFSIIDGVYVRGSLFFIDPVIKMGYIGAASIIAIYHGVKKDIEYLRKQTFNFALFAIPVLVCGILQTVSGVDFNCLGVTFGLALIYIVGITNQDSKNTDAIYSLAKSFEASYIVNMDTGKIRPLRKDMMHGKDMPGMKSMDYSTHFIGVLSRILLSEDRKNTIESFELSEVKNRFEIDNSFSIRYRVKEDSGQTAIHTAFFIRATGKEGKNEFLLGINTVNSDSLLYERNEALSQENQRLEQINMSIIESVAKIVEARDGGSGAHIVRVRKITEILAKAVMVDYPEENLTEETVKLIGSASVLHDVGKIVIPDSILLKPGRLTKEEFDIMKTHCVKGCDILNMFPLGLDDAFLECALSICRWHHEKYDGKGYPDGLKGDEIPIAAQIVSAADCYDALVSDRPYKEAYKPEKALDMIFNGECGEFSPMIISSLQKQRSKLIELARLYI